MATSRQHPVSTPWLWPKFCWEMLKNKVDSLEGVVEGLRGGRKKKKNQVSQPLKACKQVENDQSGFP